MINSMIKYLAMTLLIFGSVSVTSHAAHFKLDAYANTFIYSQNQTLQDSTLKGNAFVAKSFATNLHYRYNKWHFEAGLMYGQFDFKVKDFNKQTSIQNYHLKAQRRTWSVQLLQTKTPFITYDNSAVGLSSMTSRWIGAGYRNGLYKNHVKYGANLMLPFSADVSGQNLGSVAGYGFSASVDYWNRLVERRNLKMNWYLRLEEQYMALSYKTSGNSSKDNLSMNILALQVGAAYLF